MSLGLLIDPTSYPTASEAPFIALSVCSTKLTRSGASERARPIEHSTPMTQIRQLKSAAPHGRNLCQNRELTDPSSYPTASKTLYIALSVFPTKLTRSGD